MPVEMWSGFSAFLWHRFADVRVLSWTKYIFENHHNSITITVSDFVLRASTSTLLYVFQVCSFLSDIRMQSFFSFSSCLQEHIARIVWVHIEYFWNFSWVTELRGDLSAGMGRLLMCPFIAFRLECYVLKNNQTINCWSNKKTTYTKHCPDQTSSQCAQTPPII